MSYFVSFCDMPCPGCLYCCVKMARTLGVGGKTITVNENKNSQECWPSIYVR